MKYLIIYKSKNLRTNKQFMSHDVFYEYDSLIDFVCHILLKKYETEIIFCCNYTTCETIDVANICKTINTRQ